MPMTRQEVMDRFKISAGTFAELTRSGELPAYKIGRSVFVDESDLDKFIESRKTRPPKTTTPR